MTESSALAQTLIDHVRSQQILDLDALREDTASEIRNDGSVEVVWIATDSLPVGCSIAATYDASASPPRIRVLNEASPGRRAFSLLHEYAHHLRDQVAEVLEALFVAGERGFRLEERMCDSFAAGVLLPGTLIEPALRQGVTASSVAALIDEISASAQAVAVAAAQRLPAPGYVALLDRSGAVNYAARHGDVVPVPRGVVQEGPLRSAAAGRLYRGVSRLTYAQGRRTQEFHVDVAPCGAQAIVVAVTDSAPWTRFSAGLDGFSEEHSGWCEQCSAEFSTRTAPCRECHEPRCPTCASCGCGQASARGSRRCNSCFQVLGPGAFSSTTASECVECSS